MSLIDRAPELMFAVRFHEANATFRDGHHSFVARLMALTI
jgi:hypothetical protein